MDNYKNILEDPCIKSYLASIPQNLWNKGIKKALFIGISSLIALETLQPQDLYDIKTKVIKKQFAVGKEHSSEQRKRENSYPNENFQQIELKSHNKSSSLIPEIEKLAQKKTKHPRAESFILRNNCKSHKEKLKTDQEKAKTNIEKITPNKEKNENNIYLGIKPISDFNIFYKESWNAHKIEKKSLNNKTQKKIRKKQQKQYQIIKDLKLNNRLTKKSPKKSIKMHECDSLAIEKQEELNHENLQYRYITSSSEEISLEEV